jgi:hypothetical protein
MTSLQTISGFRHGITLGLEDQLLFAAPEPIAKLDQAQSTKLRPAFRLQVL